MAGCTADGGNVSSVLNCVLFLFVFQCVQINGFPTSTKNPRPFRARGLLLKSTYVRKSGV
jgi:hypothetical protein